MFKWLIAKIMNKNENPEETHEPLLSINNGKENKSAFSDVLKQKKTEQNSVVTTTTLTTPAKIEEKKIIEESPVSIVSTKPAIVKPQIKTKIVYEIVFINDSNEEEKIYTYELPQFSIQEPVANIFNAFGKEDMFENVLGINTVKVSCKVELEESMIAIDLARGFLFKAISEEVWMNLSYAETKQKFDEAVLRAYRDASQQTQGQGQSAKTNKPIAKRNPQFNGNQPLNNNNNVGDENYHAGNINTNRPPLINDF